MRATAATMMTTRPFTFIRLPPSQDHGAGTRTMVQTPTRHERLSLTLRRGSTEPFPVLPRCCVGHGRLIGVKATRHLPNRNVRLMQPNPRDRTWCFRGAGSGTLGVGVEMGGPSPHRRRMVARHATSCRASPGLTALGSRCAEPGLHRFLVAVAGIQSTSFGDGTHAECGFA